MSKKSYNLDICILDCVPPLKQTAFSYSVLEAPVKARFYVSSLKSQNLNFDLICLTISFPSVLRRIQKTFKQLFLD